MFTMLAPEESKAILADFRDYCKTNIDLDIFIDKYRTLPDGNTIPSVWKTKYPPYKDLGVKWTFRLNTPAPCHRNCIIEARINPQVLLHGDYITISGESDLLATAKAYNTFAKRISRKLPSFAEYALGHIHYCGNFDLWEMGYNCSVKQMLKLQKQALILSRYEEPLEYNPTSKRKERYSNGLRAESGSVIINNYGKQKQLIEVFPHNIRFA